jgi:hypothetical protein
MNPDLFITIAFVSWAVLGAIIFGLLILRSWRGDPRERGGAEARAMRPSARGTSRPPRPTRVRARNTPTAVRDGVRAERNVPHG